ncbi:MAG: hypothetical protein DRO73_11205 [Candidatus Thorarchaeota archaeon]|nr:MAG: hypothetical protein DRO73_11205 [Candidatus Thorarchaeota archaeon]
MIRHIVSGDRRGAENGSQRAVSDFNSRMGYDSVQFTCIGDDMHFEKVIDLGDGLVIFSKLSSHGVAQIRRMAEARGKPVTVFDFDQETTLYELAAWISENKIETLSVLGLKESACTGTEEKVFRSVVDLFGLSQVVP